MDIGAIGRMLGMARGQSGLDQSSLQRAQPQEKPEPDLIKRLMEMLSAGTGAQGGEGSAGSGCDECQKTPEELEQLAAGRKGMEAMMPGNDNGRQINA
ncbi:hypothetical protein [Pseudomonas tolaasii]|uniref:hypothetical protein n=1 Tax=Pseudomonas tolaasii TaxID=29442 RepID=UPI00214B418C|nr:hypothetical protein [Pseudomonas tolaasii]